MKKKVIIWLTVFCVVFTIAGVYIGVSIQGGTASLDNLITLHQVEILREQLLITLKRVQTDINFKNTRYARGAATMVSHVRAMDKVMNQCFDCHHTDPVSARLHALEANIELYKEAISRLLTIRADVERLAMEEDAAFEAGEALLNNVTEMLEVAHRKLEEKTQATLRTIDISKKVLFVLIALGPMLASLLAFFFIRSVTRPVGILLEATRKIKDARLNYRIEEELQDEFAELALSFNEMAGSLELQCKQMQRAEQLTVYGEMAAGLAHEIKTPLAGINGAMKILSRDKGISEENRMLLTKVMRENKRIETLVKDLLHYARPPKPQYLSMDFNQILEKTTDLLPQYPAFADKKEGKGIEIVKDFAVDMPLVETDPLQQQQIFLNLFVNAADAMVEGGTLTVRSRYDSDRDRIRVEVVDTGKGIDPGDMEKIFQPFFTTKPKGTGLGLPTVKRLLEQQGGSIEVRNNHDAGVTCVIVFPLRQEAGLSAGTEDSAEC